MAAASSTGPSAIAAPTQWRWATRCSARCSLPSPLVADGLLGADERTPQDDLGVNEYDGGLFSAAAHPWLVGRSVPDRLLAPALDGLYRAVGQQVDYRDLSPRHLGTIYDRLLDFRLEEVTGALVLRGAGGQHDTGSYYTPSHVVDAIVEATLEPLLARRSEANVQLGLRGNDALESFLELRVLDPAVGSGHFLVAAAAYIAQYVATDPTYDGELAMTYIQRLVAERCLYGVDLNAMAVELARLSLWLSGRARARRLPRLAVGRGRRAGRLPRGCDEARRLRYPRSARAARGSSSSTASRQPSARWSTRSSLPHHLDDHTLGPTASNSR